MAAAVLVLAACGSDGAPDPDATGSGDDGAMADDDHGDTEMAAAGEPADPADAARTIEVSTLDEMAYDPSTITVEPGEVVTFSVSNAGEAVHEFTLGDQAMQDAHAEEMADMGEEMAHDEPNSIALQPGETKELTWRFGDSGTVVYACHEPGHYDAGMRGEITVG